jgi:hypothetical protein
VAAREDESEAVVAAAGDLAAPGGDELRELLAVGRLAAQPVERLAPRRGEQPRSRPLRDPLSRPVLECLDDRFLNQLLGEIEVTEEADQR